MKKLLSTYFYLFMSLLIATIIGFAFGPNLAQTMVYPSLRPPLILYLHAAVSVAWVLLLCVQVSLVRGANLRLHRQLGQFGFALGISLPILGIATEIAMNQWHLSQGHSTNPVFFSISLNDMLSFSIAFGLAMWWRSRPEYHKRLLLIATCCLTSAAFARLHFIVPSWWFYFFVDALIVLAMIRDHIVIHSVHRVYSIGLPSLVAGQILAFFLCFQKPEFWVNLSQFLLGGAK
ncbi:hypothetical protein [Undibacterium flavidum]|uniref:Membrane protein DUF2306 n=1 Tax=Undibacterium flavidum TaxID=2762297 RepID=A0ABR6YF19_9BURK|nr:hypothetical protein [Undibacterium flavidum]MBC3875143.1 hypothetical protein [Undibacterium flavidum]